MLETPPLCQSHIGHTDHAAAAGDPMVLRRVQQWSISATGTKARPNTAQKSDLRTASVAKVGSTVVKYMMIACFQ